MCFSRGSGLGVRAVSARSRAASAKASGDEGSEEARESLKWEVLVQTHASFDRRHLTVSHRGRFPDPDLCFAVTQNSELDSHLFCGMPQESVLGLFYTPDYLKVFFYSVEYLLVLSEVFYSVQYLKAWSKVFLYSVVYLLVLSQVVLYCMEYLKALS